jgi:hypothetical protein
VQAREKYALQSDDAQIARSRREGDGEKGDAILSEVKDDPGSHNRGSQ